LWNVRAHKEQANYSSYIQQESKVTQN